MGLYYLHSAWAAMLFYQMGMAATLWRRRFDWSLLWRGWHMGHGLLLALVAGASGALLWLFKGVWMADPLSLDRLLQQFGLSGSRFPIFLIYFSIVTPILEEAFWRGLLGSTSAQIASTDLLFAGYHVLVLAAFTSIPLAVLGGGGLTIAAWLWRRQYVRHQGLAVPVISHFAADLSIMLAVHFL
ncbi:MAG: CPBP family glutamic-type intramembrane protease [Caldilineaceae bacterium]